MVDLPDRRRSGKVRGERVTLAHGAGGRAMRDLIDDIFLGAFGAPEGALEDQARLALEGYGPGARLAFTTDAFVIDPIFFPGGDIGKLAVSGTINDLAVGGARPVALSAALILEEGLPFDNLRRVAGHALDLPRRPAGRHAGRRSAAAHLLGRAPRSSPDRSRNYPVAIQSTSLDVVSLDL